MPLYEMVIFKDSGRHSPSSGPCLSGFPQVRETRRYYLTDDYDYDTIYD